MLEDHLPESRFAQPGERVVQGQRMIQAVSDIFPGLTKGAGQGRYFYWRQLRDMKGSTDVASMRPTPPPAITAGIPARLAQPGADAVSARGQVPRHACSTQHTP